MGKPEPSDGFLLLGIDTCGPSGSVALGRLGDSVVKILGETPLEGRTYSATLVAAIESLLKAHDIRLSRIGALVVVNGPGSFTGVRVGVSAAKGIAEGADIPILAVSRLLVLACKAGSVASALDAHRNEVYARLTVEHGKMAELLAGHTDLMLLPPSSPIALCEESAAVLISSAWPGTQLLRVPAPTASDALRLAAAPIRAGRFDDISLLDGHYLRRSDAEIFGEKGRPVRSGGNSR